MQAALYDADHGFYGAGRAQIGREGDFFTSVSVGPLFGRLLARQLAEMWERLGQPAQWRVVEQAAHDGRLAADVLAGLERDAPACRGAITYTLMEPSSLWQARQEETLRGVGGVEWVPGVEALTGVCGVFFSNELLDAFPVHRVRWNGAEWKELWVEWKGAGFAMVEGAKARPELAAYLGQIAQEWPAGYTTEVNLAAGKWLRETAEALARGWVWVVDYGYEREEYYRPERSDGTLSAYARQQRVENPLERPGEIDLTAHVDFTTLREVGEACGLHQVGFTDQQRLMAGLGQLHFVDTETVDAERAREQRAFMTLMHPGLLGGAFKTLCLGKKAPGELTGFRFSS